MSMDLQQHMAKHMAMQFLDQAVAEWDSLYHNASMGRHGHKWPDYDDSESEMDIFWNMFMEDIRQFGKEDLNNDIKEQFGYDWKIGIYSSGGTTVAPIDIVDHVCNHHRGEYGRTIEADDLMEFLDPTHSWGMHDDEEDIDWIDTYRRTKDCLAIFQYINQYCKGTMECLAKSWEEFKINYPDLFESDEDEDDDDDEIYDENWDEYIEEEAEVPAAA